MPAGSKHQFVNTGPTPLVCCAESRRSLCPRKEMIRTWLTGSAVYIDFVYDLLPS